MQKQLSEIDVTWKFKTPINVHKTVIIFTGILESFKSIWYFLYNQAFIYEE